MKLKRMIALVFLLPLSGVFYGCATTASSASISSSEASNKAEKKLSVEGDGGKAKKKISMAIGEDVGEFTITNQQSVETPGGYNGTEYTVKTNSGKTFKCEIMEPSVLGQVMTWGMASGTSAMCTDFTKGSKDKGKTNKASCNALLKAAGKC